MGVKSLISVVVACHSKCPELDCLMASLECQRHYENDGRAHRPTGPAGVSIEVVLSSDGPYEANNSHLVKDHVRLVTNVKEGGVGHSTRGPGIVAATGDWIVLTNADNVFALGWAQAVQSQVGHGVGMVYWNDINSLKDYKSQGGSRLKRSQIDLSCVAVRADIAKRVGFPFRNYDGDWDYIEECHNWCKKGGLQVRHIDRTLCVHN